ncbi:hypothetical protein ACHAWF_009981 [Thalassiosira exigua]
MWFARRSSSSTPPDGCEEEDLARLVDLCPFLAAERSRYDDDAVLALLRRNPAAARLRRSFRCGIGRGDGARPLALVVALGGSLEVVELLVEACPEALEERLSGKRNVLHYAVAEGAGVEVVRYLASERPSLAEETDSFEAVPLHLAASYPASPPGGLRHLLSVFPEGARAEDFRLLTPLHRACRSRASLEEKVLPLVEAHPDALFAKDGGGNTPLGWAERMDHSLTEPLPEVAEALEMVEDVLTLGADGSGAGRGGRDADGCADARRRAEEDLARFRSFSWRGGVRLAFVRNLELLPLLEMPTGLLPDLLALVGGDDGADDDVGSGKMPGSSINPRLGGVFSVLVRRPNVLGWAS